MDLTHKSTLLVPAVAALAILACGGDGDTTATSVGEESTAAPNVGETIGDEVERRTGRKPASGDRPCEILDDELIRVHFEIAAEAEITRSPSKYSPHPLCTVSWPKPNAAEIEERSAAEMQDYVMKKMKGEDAKMPSLRTTNEVSLTVYEPEFEDPAAARSGFDSAMKMLSDGITGSHEDVEVTVQADLTPVEGVGDEAMWAPKMNQLSIVDDTRIFHVTVSTGTGDEADLESAKAIARTVAAEL